MNKQEFTQRVLAMENRLYRISCGMLFDANDRMDAVQEAVVKAWANVHRLKNERYFETWLTRILINECHNIQRLRKKIIPLETVPEKPTSDEKDRNIKDAVLALEEEFRLPVMLHFMEGYKIREVAEILRIPEGTVKTRLARARKILKQLLEEDEA